jgi:hypothetical protein
MLTSFLGDERDDAGFAERRSPPLRTQASSAFADSRHFNHSA